ncbi:hypothetical protein [Lacipirellula limnantheis]|uniref:Uncharacterized protein n=1 Tax=Lacipirellula limnantheis TaxID=2528024 RepID=A0A517TXL7_9BACT|nr:hypothetical protein [Lacipirellula limnantheis]QDT73125.1 hypothetical protein I41_23140 [Lacipirellula limnantheis]
MSCIEWTDDETGMRNGFREFPERDAVSDIAVDSLIAKGLLELAAGKIVVSPAGAAWLNLASIR